MFHMSILAHFFYTIASIYGVHMSYKKVDGVHMSYKKVYCMVQAMPCKLSTGAIGIRALWKDF